MFPKTSTAAKAGKKCRVLLIDDHALFRDGLRMLLGDSGAYDIVGQASDAKEGERLARALEPDLAIVDITLHKSSGLEALIRIKQDSPKTRALMLSMHANPALVHTALNNGADGYVLKDAAADDLFRALDSVRKGKRYLTPSLTQSLVDYLGREPAAPDELSQLSGRERQVLQLLADGHSNKEIAEKIFLSVKSVETYRSRLMKKLNLKDVVALTKFAIRHGIISP